ncbi:MAG: Eco57I restriction-modification methylase domain-containing protein [Bacteroidetes bacterium]|nr:Eco57I restriction-modification methylase domain-containing protein [Bacteroidota bacterium]
MLRSVLLSPRKSLNKAYLKVKPTRSEIELFKKNLIGLLDGLDESESEEHVKNDLGDFLKNTFYHPKFYINTKERTDLVIHNGNDSKSFAGVLIEAKKPSNKAEMIRPDNLNAKAFHELILYYLRERITNHNLEIKHLVATNIYEWYVFDAILFDKIFAQDKRQVQHFTDFEEGRLAGKTTDFFYKEIAEPFMAGMDTEISFSWFDFREYDKPLRNEDKKDDSKLIALFKLLSPEHLLKLPFANDSNSLDKAFYSELLHIIGLTETKEGSKKLIGRRKEGERNAGSLIESAIIQLDNLDKIARLDKPAQFGETVQERLFNVALELSITWINRILFLKLLEAQMIRYHKGDLSFAFLSSEKVQNFDDLNTLFFGVLARMPGDRSEEAKKLFANVPYLNSSLFEPTPVEHSCLFISQLKDGRLPVISSTVLKDNNGKKCTGELPALDYLFKFLDAYDFAGEGSEEIQEENKTLINASVLGLIFEKINGYKDGSFFTPGFITMYMCRETIRRAVVQKFNDEGEGERYNDLTDVYNAIGTDFSREEANRIINSLKICDPAVGSGHFLVSALNEIISIKSELRILADKEGKRLKEYHVEVVNDELIVTDEDGDLFEYNPNSEESQRVQETLFREKQTIIENCLFGVDINPNSVKICRLRLWIELLKNSYYAKTGELVNLRIGESENSPVHQLTSSPAELQTLPNIDINIKCGNSLISRYALDADIRQALKNSKWSIGSYRLAVMSYRNATNKEEKRGLEQLIDKIKSDFQTEVGQNDPRIKKRDKLLSDLYQRFTGHFLFEPEEGYGGKEHENKRKKEQKKIEDQIAKLNKEIEEIKENKIFENAFEWRFEFPEVLNDEGDFIGFDVVIGNPPYIRADELGDFKEYLKESYKLFASGGDVFSYFYELSHKILTNNGKFCFINNTYDKTAAGQALREFVMGSFQIEQYIDFTSVIVFEEATTYPIIILAAKGLKPNNFFNFFKVDEIQYRDKDKLFLKSNFSQVSQNSMRIDVWNFRDEKGSKILAILQKNKSLREVYSKCFYGVKTALNEAFILSKKLSNNEELKPVYDGKDIKKWNTPLPFKWMIVFESKSTKQRFGNLSEEGAKEKMSQDYQEIFNHLLPFEELAKKRYDKGEYWWELRNCAYYDLFKQPKIIFPNLQNSNKFAFDETGTYLNAPSVFIPTTDKALLGILNSKLIWYFLTSICVIRSGGFIEVKPQYFEQIPIPEISNEAKQTLTEKVNQILFAKKISPIADTSALEKEIDKLVYELYGLTEVEIRIVEGGG